MIQTVRLPSSNAPQVKRLPQRPGPINSTFLHTCSREKRVNAAKYTFRPNVQLHPEEEELPITKLNTIRPGRNMYLEEKNHWQVPRLSRLLIQDNNIHW